MANKNHLPYFQIYSNRTHRGDCRTLRRIFPPKIRRNSSGITSLFEFRPATYLRFIRSRAGQYPYFYKLDIAKYYPSVQHRKLIREIERNYCLLTGKTRLSRKMQSLISHRLPRFLESSPFSRRGLPLGDPLTYILGNIFFYRLEKRLTDAGHPFARFADDWVIFFKDRGQLRYALTYIIEPTLDELGLQSSPTKSREGRTHQDPLYFLGFVYQYGYFSISEDKIAQIRQKITRLTILSRSMPRKALIKRINRRIKGFGHYYKFASCKKDFADLDAYIRKRVRRKLTRARDNRNREDNLVLTNRNLSELGLRSLTDIKHNFDAKKRKNGKKRDIKEVKRRPPAKQSREELTKNSLYSALESQRLELQRLRKEVMKVKKEIRRMNKKGGGDTSEKELI